MGPGKVAALVAVVIGCAGPRPEVDRVSVARSPVAGRMRVEAEVRNQSGGTGEIDVQVELRDVRGGPPIEAERTVELAGHGVTHFVADVEAPPGDYHAAVHARYPPE
jgi:hypothetical protein